MSVDEGRLRVSSDGGIPLRRAGAVHGSAGALSALSEVIRTGKAQYLPHREERVRHPPQEGTVPTVRS
ncbi:hypothetical protein BFF78_04745 [Streptomyces fodineus]|uniref:Uncharacterized protein n=1 Tax=Streptomyces fodineus TaxID=1904616 RepID=A0A1D7Y4C8_9ACTN|nr:hypothetical protein [Streptomyces fodineus]AOR30447.1 hypothetical protein BFF78_04745 [Streptomyces fodineus]